MTRRLKLMPDTPPIPVPDTANDLSHFDASGATRMVDVGAKEVTDRTARASGLVRLAPATLEKILNRDFIKGDVLEVARLAGIQAAKKTWALIPLCHLLPLDGVRLEFTPQAPDTLEIVAEVRCHGKTGVEMEAMVAVSVAALTIYDMVKGIDRVMVIERIRLDEKSGGRTGAFQRT